jgi:predicted AAA+ superfamily ATPase
MEIPLTLSILYLWRENNDIKKNDWGSINYLVGPNGTGKSLWLEIERRNHRHFSQNNLLVRYLNSERLSGLEKRDYNRKYCSEKGLLTGRNNTKKCYNTCYCPYYNWYHRVGYRQLISYNFLKIVI